MIAQTAQVEELIDLSKKVIGRDVVIEIERVEQLRLLSLTPHHANNPFDETMSSVHHQASSGQEFFNGIGRQQPVRLLPALGNVIAARGQIRWRRRSVRLTKVSEPLAFLHHRAS